MENGYLNFVCWILLEGECLRYSRESLENVYGDITKYKEPYKLITGFQDL